MRFLAERRQRRERRERRERMIPRNLVTPPRSRRRPRPRRRAWGNGLPEYWSIGKLTGPLLLACIFLAGCPGPKFNPPPSVSPTPTQSPTATPVPTPTPEAIIPYSHKEVARLFNGVEVHSHVESGNVDISAVERKTLD